MIFSNHGGIWKKSKWNTLNFYAFHADKSNEGFQSKLHLKAPKQVIKRMWIRSLFLKVHLEFQEGLFEIDPDPPCSTYGRCPGIFEFCP